MASPLSDALTAHGIPAGAGTPLESHTAANLDSATATTLAELDPGRPLERKQQRDDNLLPNNTPVWHTKAQQPPCRLARDISCDMCVIGGGVIGLTCAYELAHRGHKVVVLDAGRGTSGQTSRSTAHLVTALDERYFTLEHSHGTQTAAAAADQHTRAIAWMENVIITESIDCEFTRIQGLLVLDPSKRNRAEQLLKQESDAAARANIIHEHFDTRTVPGLEGFYECGLRFPGQAQVDPLRFIEGLTYAILRRGGKVYCFERATDISPNAEGVRIVTSTDHVIQAKHVIMATHELPPELKQGLRGTTTYASFVVAFELPAHNPQQHNITSSDDNNITSSPWLLWDGYWGDASPYHYVRTSTLPPRAGLSLPTTCLLVGGEDVEYDTIGDITDRYDLIELWTRAHHPSAGPRIAAWWGQIVEPDGEFPLIGALPNHPNIYAITGDSGNGFTYAAIAAHRLANIIESKPTDPIEDVMFSMVRHEHAKSPA